MAKETGAVRGDARSVHRARGVQHQRCRCDSRVSSPPAHRSLPPPSHPQTRAAADPRARLLLLELVSERCGLLLAGSRPEAVRVLYEAARDAAWRHLALPGVAAPAAPSDVPRLRAATLSALSSLLHGTDALATDPRLFRTHVQFLLGLLASVTSSDWEVAGAAEALRCAGPGGRW